MKIKDSERVFKLLGENNFEFIKWENAISNCITRSQGQKKSLSFSSYSKDPKQVFQFLESQKLYEKAFIDQIDSGDILLSELNQKSDKFVFLILKLDGLNKQYINNLADKIYILEIQGDDNKVCLVPWGEFKV